MAKWHIHQDRDVDDPELNSYTLTLQKNQPGWNTDSGYSGYGLPKELAQWICDTLNESGKECPFEMNSGWWEKKEQTEEEHETD